MEYAYLILFVFLILFFAFLVGKLSDKVSRKDFTLSRMNLVKRFITVSLSSVNDILSSGSVILSNQRFNRISGNVRSLDDLMLEFVKLLQKLFEAKFVVSLKVSKEGLVYQVSTDPFFPFISGISKLKEIFESSKPSEIIEEKVLKLLSKSMNKHRFVIPSDLSIFTLKDVVEVCREIKSNSILLVPLYRDEGISNLIIVFTNNYNMYYDSQIMVNILSDFLSLFLLYVSAKQSLRHFVLEHGPESSDVRLVFYEVLFNTRSNEVISKTPEDEKFWVFWKLVNIGELKEGLKYNKIFTITRFSEVEELGGVLLEIVSEYIDDSRIRIKIYGVEKSFVNRMDEVFLRVSDLINLPIVIFEKVGGRIVKLNKNFIDTFSEYNNLNSLDDLKSKLKYISEGKVIQSDVVYSIEPLYVEESKFGSIFFYPVQIVNQKTAIDLHYEAMRIRKIVSSVEAFSGIDKLRNINFYFKYQPADKILEVGGDFFVALEIGKKTFVGVFDVSGHNISSAFVASNIKNIIERSILEDRNIQKTIEYINNLIYSLNQDNSEIYTYITGILCEVDVDRMRMKIISAGHRYGVILKEDGIVTFQKLIHIHKPIGIKKDEEYRPEEIYINRGDKFFLYTDGIVELEDVKKGEVDESKIIDLIVFFKNLSVKDTIQEIFSYIRALKEVRIRDDFIILGFSIKS
ncbi:MAG: serine/threonine-protein phosphatase [Brevinematales bacterium]|nr:serine/threonine-protein phosphatase [Brevinematales bacterium]